MKRIANDVGYYSGNTQERNLFKPAEALAFWYDTDELNLYMWWNSGRDSFRAWTAIAANYHPKNDLSHVRLDWSGGGIPRIRIAGTGIGTNVGFQIQKASDAVIFEVQNDGTIRLPVATDLYNVPWTEFAGDSTTLGWSSYTAKSIRYKRVGGLIFVDFYLQGTSNSTGASFTLPYDFNEFGVCGPVAAKDNGVAIGTAIYYFGTAQTCTLYTDLDATGWTASGTKDIRGQFFYEVL